MNDHKILDAIDQANPARTRSPLARWMFENHDAFAARLSAWRTDWTLLAQVFVEAGLTDADGKPPNSVIARKTWQRVATHGQEPADAAAGVACSPAGDPACCQPNR